MFDVSVIIPSWNNLALLQKCIPNLKKTRRLDTQIFVALNESQDGSPEYLRSEGIEFVCLQRNWTTLSVDFLASFLQSRYVVNMNDDSLCYHGWDEELVKIVEEYYPCASGLRGVEKGDRDGNVVLGDWRLPDWLHPEAEREFFQRTAAGQYKRDRIRGLFHPICCRTEDFFTVGGYSDNWDLRAISGHSLDTEFAIRLWNLNHDYQFILSGDSPYYHGSSMTNNRVREVDPERNNQHNKEWLFEKTGFTHESFHKLIRYGEKA